MILARSKPRSKATASRGKREALFPAAELIPEDAKELVIEVDGHTLKLTNLRKLFWPELGVTKGDLLRYYAAVSPMLLPHLVNRAMVMKRYPNGAHDSFFFQKRAPTPRPSWIETCPIPHKAEREVDYPLVQNLASLLWTVNLGCIDLNPWYARCDDVDRPDYLHFDLDPTDGGDFGVVRDTALLVRDALAALKIPCLAKTTGSRGIHVYVPIVRGPTQKQVWVFAKELARSLEHLYPDLVTTEYRVAKRPKGHVLVDYNQNAWGRTLASVYSVRPKPRAPVSAPVSWEEVAQGIRISDFRIDNVPARLEKLGDLWKPLLQAKGRFRLETVL